MRCLYIQPDFPSLDEQWTKEETDYLFGLVEGYDLRWYVVHDRYDFPNGPLRTLEVSLPI
jgi:DNA methyltransferase 1-associated protein 1